MAQHDVAAEVLLAALWRAIALAARRRETLR